MTQAADKKGYVKGSLSQVPFPKVINFVFKSNKTGVLAIAREKKKVHIHFLDGEIVYVTSSYFPGLSLGDFLLKEGKITLQVHDESLEKIQDTGVKQGTYLVEKGFLSPHDMIETLNRQVLEKLFWLFEWEDGDFFFKEGEIISEELRNVKIPIQRLIYLGVREHIPLKNLPTEFKGRKESRLFRRPNLPFRLDILGLGPIDTRALSFVTGNYTLRQIVALSRLKKRAIYQILYGLFLTDVICFPEGLPSVRSQSADKTDGETPKEGAAKESYEISISSDLIAQAVQSVDRIKEEIKLEIDTAPAVVAEPAAVATPAQPMSEIDELGVKLDQALSTEEKPAVDEHFGFNDASPDGFDYSQDGDSNIDGYKPGDRNYDPNSAEDQLGYEEQSEYSEDQYSEEEFEDMDYAVDVKDFSDPEEIKKQGIMLLEEGRWEDSEIFLNRASELLPEDFDIFAYLGWAIYNAHYDSSDGFYQAEQVIKQGMGPGKSSFQHFLFLGKLYSDQGQFEFAELHFIKALELNVDCAEAREQIKMIHAK